LDHRKRRGSLLRTTLRKEWKGKARRKTKNDVIGQGDERIVERKVEGEDWTSWPMASFDVLTCLERQRAKEKKRTQDRVWEMPPVLT